MCWTCHWKECSPITLNARLRLICTVVDESHSSNKGEKFVRAPQRPSKLARQNPIGLKGRLLSMVLRSDRARSQALWLRYPDRESNPKGPQLGWQVKLMQRADKDQVRDQVPLISCFLLEKSSVSCLETGFMQGVSVLIFLACSHHALLHSRAFLSSSNIPCSLLPQDLCTWWTDLFALLCQVSAYSSSYKSQLNNQSSGKPSFMP